MKIKVEDTKLKVEVYGVTIILETLPQINYRFKLYIDGGMLCNGDDAAHYDTVALAMDALRKEILTISEEAEGSHLGG